jgi:hypothetical protein
VLEFGEQCGHRGGVAGRRGAQGDARVDQ